MKKKIDYYEYLRSIHLKKMITTIRVRIVTILLLFGFNVGLYLNDVPHIYGYVLSCILFALILYSIHCFLVEIKYFNPALRRKQIAEEFLLLNKEKNLLFLQIKSMSNGSVPVFNETNRVLWKSLERKSRGCSHRKMLVKLRQEHNSLGRKISKLRWEMRCAKVCTTADNFWKYYKNHSHQPNQRQQIEAFWNSESFFFILIDFTYQICIRYSITKY